MAVLQGLSLTAMKSACRRIGVTRWPYSRHRQPARTGEEAPLQLAASSDMACLPHRPAGDEDDELL
eukprot:267555-Hanusia_phi.AAC.1